MTKGWQCSMMMVVAALVGCGDAALDGGPGPDDAARDGDATTAGEVTATMTGPSLDDVATLDAEPPASLEPEIVVLEQGRLAPQTLVHLDAKWRGGVAPVVFRWSSTQPALSASLFEPSAIVKAPTFRVDAAGIYTFTVEVTDAGGARAQRSRTVIVAPTAALHVELLWRTPGDRNALDTGEGAGADLDLHFVRAPDPADPYAGPALWFDATLDCFWANAAPTWGTSSDRPDGPTLDRDDTDGGGPENLNLDGPEADTCYRIAVHAWDDHGYGASLATVRVFVMGTLAYEEGDVALADGDLWDVGVVCWLGGDASVTPRRVCGGDGAACTGGEECASGAACGPSIAHEYPTP